MENLKEQTFLTKSEELQDARMARRAFLKYTGAGAAGVALLAAGCKKDRNNDPGIRLGR